MTSTREPVKRLRDEFAIAALGAIMADPELNCYSRRAMAAGAYEQADAMMEAREGEEFADTSTLEEAEQYFHFKMEGEKSKAAAADFFTAVERAKNDE